MAHSKAIKYFAKRELDRLRKRVEELRKNKNKGEVELKEIKQLEEKINYLHDSIFRHEEYDL